MTDQDALTDDACCWRSECRTGCHYPQVCSERPALCPLCAKPAHDYRCGVTP
jgi:hypothetical protein